MIKGLHALINLKNILLFGVCSGAGTVTDAVRSSERPDIPGVPDFVHEVEISSTLLESGEDVDASSSDIYSPSDVNSSDSENGKRIYHFKKRKKVKDKRVNGNYCATVNNVVVMNDNNLASSESVNESDIANNIETVNASGVCAPTADAIPAELSQESVCNEKKRGRKKVIGDGTRKRKRNPDTWVRNVRKTQKTEGKEYITSKGKVIKGKEVKPSCNCRRKCGDKFTDVERAGMFASYYSLSKESQNQYIAANVKEFDKKTQRLRRNEPEPSRRQFSRKYVLNKGDKSIEVCQKMFLSTFDLTLKKVRVITEKKRSSSSGICTEDERGKHTAHACMSEKCKQVIRDHIAMFPAYKSHYSRSHTSKKYLSPDLSIAKMYRLYLEYCSRPEICVQPASESFYRHIFVNEFNLAFKNPQNDTCAKCDQYEMIMKTAENVENCTQAEKEKDLHLTLAEASYAEKRKDKLKSKTDSRFVTVSFDLQKCLPTPFLVSGLSFYKRQLWTLNLTLYETNKCTSKPICYIWNETIAARGGQEVASCLFKYLDQLPENVEEICFYSDCCPGQNRNIYVAIMFLTKISSFTAMGRTITINHKFLESGHTHMEADSIHALIEKSKKNTTLSIELPRDWANLIRMIQRKPPITVLEMEQKEFLNFKDILKTTYIHRTTNTEGETVFWRKIKWIKYTPSHPGQMLYKYNFEEEESFKILDLSRKQVSRRSAIKTVDLKPIAVKPIPLSVQKLADLKSLQPFIHPNSRLFYSAFLSLLEDSPEKDDDTTEEEEECE